MTALRLLVDADACPVREEVCRVARRTGVPATFVSNAGVRLPREPLFTAVVVGSGFDAADDWIAAAADAASIVVTADILLAARCLKAGATVIAPNGKPFTAASIGGAVAARALAEERRAYAVERGPGAGPPPFSARDRSTFLSALDSAIVRLRRSYLPAATPGSGLPA